MKPQNRGHTGNRLDRQLQFQLGAILLLKIENRLHGKLRAKLGGQINHHVLVQSMRFGWG